LRHLFPVHSFLGHGFSPIKKATLVRAPCKPDFGLQGW
jgi:hypothetical protein